MKTVVTALFFFFIPTIGISQTSDDLGHYDIYVVFIPLVSNPSNYEVLNRIEYIPEVTLPDSEKTGPACVVHLDQESIDHQDVVPLDAYGQPMILLDDQLTWLPTDDLVDLAISDKACRRFEGT